MPCDAPSSINSRQPETSCASAASKVMLESPRCLIHMKTTYKPSCALYVVRWSRKVNNARARKIYQTSVAARDNFRESQCCGRCFREQVEIKLHDDGHRSILKTFVDVNGVSLLELEILGESAILEWSSRS